VEHIIGVLGFRKVCARWAPRMLSDEMKAERVRSSRELLERFEKEGEDFFKKTITGDETWSIIMTPRTKGNPWNTVIRNHLSRKIQNTGFGWKGYVDCFWNSVRVVLADFLAEETTINSQRYIETLTALKRRIERIGIRNETLLQHDNARPYTSAATRDVIQRLDFSALPHPPYSPDLAPSNFHLFPKLKAHLKGQRFSCEEEVNSAVRKWFQKQNTNFFKDGFQKLVQRWRKCIEVPGDFVEK